jgi:hypothetical protein
MLISQELLFETKNACCRYQNGNRQTIQRKREIIERSNSNDQEALILSRNIPEGLNVTTLLASRVSSSPVCGLRPRRAFLSLTLNLPNPLNKRSLPVIKEFFEIRRNDSTDSVACAFVNVS